MDLGEREEELEKIKRYVHYTSPIMFYRTNDLVHSKRVVGHLKQMIPQIKEVYENNFDYNFAIAAAEVHDDPEIITTDITLYDKELMSKKELMELSDQEEIAIKKLVERYGLFFKGQGYENMLLSTKNKDRLESQFISFCDKLDGAGEAWNEVWAGNPLFAIHAGDYIERFKQFPIKYPAMIPFFKKFPEYIVENFNFFEIPYGKEPHTEKSLKRDSGFNLYELWKKSVIETEGTKNLVTQLEFY